MKISIKNIINSTSAISIQEGIAVFDALDSAINTQGNVDLSFDEMEDCTTLFLNYSLGKIYEKYNNVSIVNIVDISSDSIWNKKIERTKTYYSSPENTAQFDKINDEVSAY